MKDSPPIIYKILKYINNIHGLQLLIVSTLANFSELDNLFRQLDPKSTTPLFLTDYYKPDKRQKPRELFFEKVSSVD